MGQETNEYKFGDVLDFGGTLTFDLPNIKQPIRNFALLLPIYTKLCC